MLVKQTLLTALSAFLVISPLHAQSRDRSPAGHGFPSSVTTGRQSPGHAAPRGPVGWSAFHHDTSPARVSPHRYGSTNLPRANAWHGDIGSFGQGRWQQGQWQHVGHNGRFGWWWVVGPDWYFFNTPVYPYPDLYTPFNEPFGWWYWCDASQEYYPYVTTCAVPWESVMPRE